MPFSSNEELVKKVKGTGKLSDKKQRQFRHIFNQCFKDKGDSGSCYAQAWGAVRKSASERRKLAREILHLAKSLLSK
jgi:cation transport regulator ChaB